MPIHVDMPNHDNTTVSPAKPTTVVVVDDHPAMRSALRMMFDCVPDVAVVGEGATVAEACAVVEEQEPDLVLLDLRLQGEDGLEVARRLHDRDALTRILVLSASERIGDLRAALDAGADGFLSKSAASTTVVDGVRRTVAGQRVLGQEFSSS